MKFFIQFGLYNIREGLILCKTFRLIFLHSYLFDKKNLYCNDLLINRFILS